MAFEGAGGLTEAEKKKYGTKTASIGTMKKGRKTVVPGKGGGGGGGGGFPGGGGGGGGMPQLPPGYGAGGPGGGGAQFRTESPGYMKEVQQMYRDLIEQNRALAGEYDVEDLMSKQRAEHSIQQREAEAMGERSGGLSAAERRNMAMDQSRGMAETRGGAERGKLEFERGLLQDLTGGIGGASGLAGEEGQFLNQARRNEQDLYKYMRDYPLRQAEIQARIQNSQMGALAQLAALA